MSRFSNLVAILLLLPAGSALAQEPAPADTASAMYEHGVSSYFDGNFSRAEMYLNRSLEIRPTDPRAHYFLGLTMLRQGRSAEAEAAIQQGAAVEAVSGMSGSVGHALESVQGSERIELERIRKAAGTNPSTVADDNARRRQEQFERRQQAVLRKPVYLPLEVFINPVSPEQIAAQLIDLTGPTSLAEMEQATTEETSTEETEVLTAADVGDPFTDDPVTTTSTDAAPGATGGGVKASSLPGIFGRIFKRNLPTIDTEGIRDMVPSGVPGLGGGLPPGMPGGAGPEGFGPEGFGPEGFGPEGFGPQGFGPGEAGPGEFGPTESGDEESPFGPDEPSPFGPDASGEDSTPPSGEMEENPFQ